MSALPEGVIPKLLCLPVSARGVDDRQLNDLSIQGEVLYVERTFQTLEGHEHLIGVWHVYAEVRVSEATRAVSRRLLERSELEDTSPVDEVIAARVARLKAWRLHVSAQLKLPAYQLFNNRQMLEIARRHPQSLSQLGELHGIGAQRLRRYGESILAVLHDGADPLSWPLGQRRDSEE